MTIRRFILGVTIVGVIGGAAPALAAESELQSQDHDSCIVEMTGDVNVSGAITSADIIYLVKTIFKTGPEPLPCSGAGDVTCNGIVTSADLVYLVNFTFKNGPEPCDICDSEFAFGQNCTR